MNWPTSSTKKLRRKPGGLFVDVLLHLLRKFRGGDAVIVAHLFEEVGGIGLAEIKVGRVGVDEGLALGGGEGVAVPLPRRTVYPEIRLLEGGGLVVFVEVRLELGLLRTS